MTKFFLLESSSERTYAYAFRDAALGPLTHRLCDACGRTRSECSPTGPHHFLLDGGPRYPDRLEYTDAGGPHWILSRRAATIFAENHITGIEEVIPVRTERAGKALPAAAPEYVLAQIDGRIELDLTKMGLKKKNLCKTCGTFEWNRQRLHPLFPDGASWDGSDICRVASIPGYVVCTARVVDLVKKQKLRGFSFRPL